MLAHRGKIRAESPDAGTLCIVVSLTAKRGRPPGTESAKPA